MVTQLLRTYGLSSPALAHTGFPVADASAVLQMAQGHLQNGSVHIARGGHTHNHGQGGRSARALLEECPMRRIINFCTMRIRSWAAVLLLGSSLKSVVCLGWARHSSGYSLRWMCRSHTPLAALVGLLFTIDTEGSFAVERVEQVAEACMRHLQQLAASPNGTSQQADELHG
ncbi:hypothetical protein WJX84_003417 [Apatococcus fuscideae]|uniref:Uncharacterized protein n=1 Tax=Apatococcus fuscideae TaxID=2026836 RepID=A0AAW1SPE3_9CHLO